MGPRGIFPSEKSSFGESWFILEILLLRGGLKRGEGGQKGGFPPVSFALTHEGGCLQTTINQILDLFVVQQLYMYNVQKWYKNVLAIFCFFCANMQLPAAF